MSAAPIFRRSKGSLRITVWALCVLSVTGCSVLSSTKRILHIGPDRPALRELRVSADTDANRGNATELDIVVAFSDQAVAALPKTGPDWFRQREALRSAFPKDLAVVSLEVPTPSPEFEVELPKGTRNEGLVVQAYANYAARRGWPAIALTPFKRVALRLDATSISVAEDK